MLSLENPASQNVEAGRFQFRNRLKILATARKLAREGVLQKGMSQEEIVDAIAAAMITDDPAVFADPAFDWQSFLKLILELLPLILAIFGL